MGGLKKTEKLAVRRGAPEGVIRINPNETICIDFMVTTGDFNLYLNIDDFIKDSGGDQKVTIQQVNDLDLGAVDISPQLARELDNPREFILFRKNQNIFFKKV